jgi:hypothetical protein
MDFLKNKMKNKILNQTVMLDRLPRRHVVPPRNDIISINTEFYKIMIRTFV